MSLTKFSLAGDRNVTNLFLQCIEKFSIKRLGT
jgi:hypothetical protein